MSERGNKMSNKYYEKLITMKTTLETYRYECDEKMKKLIDNLKSMITSTITLTMDQITIYKSSPDPKDSPKAQNLNTEVTADRRNPPLDSGNSMKTGSM